MIYCRDCKNNFETQESFEKHLLACAAVSDVGRLIGKLDAPWAVKAKTSFSDVDRLKNEIAEMAIKEYDLMKQQDILQKAHMESGDRLYKACDALDDLRKEREVKVKALGEAVFAKVF